MEKTIFKEHHYIEPGKFSGTIRLDIKSHLATVKSCIEKGATILLLEWTSSRLNVEFYRKMSPEEVLQEDIQNLTEQLKQKSKDLLRVQGKIN
jgi:hypothetical protein